MKKFECKTCGEKKPLSKFSKDKSRRYGHMYKCKECNKEHEKWRYKIMTPEQRRKYIEEVKSYNKKNKEKIREYRSEYQKKKFNDIIIKFHYRDAPKELRYNQSFLNFIVASKSIQDNKLGFIKLASEAFKTEGDEKEKIVEVLAAYEKIITKTQKNIDKLFKDNNILIKHKQ